MLFVEMDNRFLIGFSQEPPSSSTNLSAKAVCPRGLIRKIILHKAIDTDFIVLDKNNGSWNVVCLISLTTSPSA